MSHVIVKSYTFVSLKIKSTTTSPLACPRPPPCIFQEILSLKHDIIFFLSPFYQYFIFCIFILHFCEVFKKMTTCTIVV